MNILLIQPPMTISKTEVFGVTPPLGLAYLAAVVEQDGHRTRILDTIVEGFNCRQNKNGLSRIGMPIDAIRNYIRRFHPDLVGITCPFSLMAEEMRAVAAAIKEVDPYITIAVGGTHPSSMPEHVIEDSNVDFVIVGEGEVTFRELTSRLEDGGDLQNLKGVWLKVDGKARKNADREPILDLDALPFPARHLLPIEKYIQLSQTHGSQKRKRYTSMITSRGCPGRCVFCSIHNVWGYNWRARSPENVVDEIEKLVTDYKMREVHFEDDNLTLSRQRMAKICDLIEERGLDVGWTTPNGVAVQTLDAELLAKMRKSGCYQLCFGIESGDAQVLKNIIHKPLSLKKVQDVVNWSKDLGIWTHGFFVIGFPGESPQSVQRTITFAKETDLDSANFFIATPYPGTPLSRLAADKGCLKGDVDPAKLRTMGASMDTGYFQAADLIVLQKKAYFDFMKHRLKREILGGRMLARTARVRSPDDLAFMLQKIKRFVHIFS
jgi:anaerobic magnesium-protoporphyrin IX monomethyl ester cyclase